MLTATDGPTSNLPLQENIFHYIRTSWNSQEILRALTQISRENKNLLFNVSLNWTQYRNSTRAGSRGKNSTTSLENVQTVKINFFLILRSTSWFSRQATEFQKFKKIRKSGRPSNYHHHLSVLLIYYALCHNNSKHNDRQQSFSTNETSNTNDEQCRKHVINYCTSCHRLAGVQPCINSDSQSRQRTANFDPS